LAVLGLEAGASQEAIKKAYRRLAAQHHPDKGGDADEFVKISNAYEFLTGKHGSSDGASDFGGGGSAAAKGPDALYEALFRFEQEMGSQWMARGAPLLETVKSQLKNRTAIEEALNAQLEAAWPEQDGGWLAKTKNSAARLVGKASTKLMAKLAQRRRLSHVSRTSLAREPRPSVHKRYACRVGDVDRRGRGVGRAAESRGRGAGQGLSGVQR
jgi:hypothetical protein